LNNVRKTFGLLLTVISCQAPQDAPVALSKPRVPAASEQQAQAGGDAATASGQPRDDGSDGRPPSVGVSGPSEERVALVEYGVSSEFTDVVYQSPAPSLGGEGFQPSLLLGMALPTGSSERGTLRLYRCRGLRTAVDPQWQFSFFSTDPSCAGNPFDRGQTTSVAPVATIYADDSKLADGKQEKVAVYRYWVDTSKGSVPVLSTVTPGAENLVVMRYREDPLLGKKPLGFILRADANLDGNGRWLSGVPQRLCFGASSFTGECPRSSGSSVWTIRSALTGAVLASKTATDVASITWTPDEIESIRRRVRSHRLALVTVEQDGLLRAAKGVRIVKLPFLSQYDNNTETGFFATEPSAHLMANQMTGHPQLTHPFADRLVDPALYDGVATHTMYDASLLMRATPVDVVMQSQRESFQKFDRTGALVVAEIPYSFTNKLGFVYPFNPFQAVRCDTDGASVDAYAGESFDVTTGTFVRQNCAQRSFFVDYANPAVVAWLKQGVRPYLETLRSLGIHLAGVSFSEVSIQHGDPADADHANNTRLHYFQSPTFSKYAFRAFSAWLRAVGAHSSFVALPVLPGHYEVARRAGNPSLYRIQPTSPESELWNLWSIWRRDIFNRTVGLLAAELKVVHSSFAYTRAPLAVFYYDYAEWNILGNQQFRWKIPRGGGYAVHGISNDGDAAIRVSPGVDFDIANQTSPRAFDYFVHEVKYFEDSWVNAEIDRIVSFKSRQTTPVRIGVHVEVDEFNPGTSYTNAHFAKVFPNNDFANPAVNVIWTWESQCKYVMSQKDPDPADNEIFFGDRRAGAFTVTNWGEYKSIYDSHKGIVGPFCLERYWASLGKQCSNGTCRDHRPLRVVHENFRRLMSWRRAYLEGDSWDAPAVAP